MSFYNQRAIKAVRKARQCDECGHQIVVGSPAVDWAQMFDGDFYAGSAHPDCLTWASAVIPNEYGEGRPFLREADPTEVDWNLAWLKANPTSPELYGRLPRAWQECVDLAGSPTSEEGTGR